MKPTPEVTRALDGGTRPQIIERVVDCLRERFVVIDHQYRILAVNESALPNGSLKDEILGQYLFDVYPNLLAQGFEQLIIEVFKTGNPHIEFYVRHTTVDNFTGFHHRKVIPLIDADGVVEGVTLIIENVHEERLTQLQNKQAEFEYTQLIETLNLVSFELDASGTIIQINKAVKPVLGFDQSQMIGKSFTKCIHPDDIRKTWHVYWQIVNLGKLFGVCENRFAALDGSYVHMRWNIHPMFNEQGTVIGCRGVGENITEDQLRLDDLKSEVRMFDETFHVVTTPMIVVKDGDVKKMNRAFARWFRISARGKMPTIAEISEQLGSNEFEIVYRDTQGNGTARAHATREGVPMVISGVRIHNAVVIALDTTIAVQ